MINVIYVMWLREMKRFIRAKSRVIGMLSMPLMFLAFLGFGFSNISIPGISKNINYIHFLVPGIIGMGMLFTSTFAGISVLWDREFGFLKEIMVAPVSRISIVLGRLAGGITTGLIQGISILFVSLIVGFKIPGILQFFIAIVFMVLISVVFIGLGLIFASKMKDMQGFNLIMNFIIFPVFFLSGAIFPLQNLPEGVRLISYFDPLTYGIDGMRAAFLGTSLFPIIYDFFVLFGFSLIMIFLGAYFFEKSESV